MQPWLALVYWNRTVLLFLLNQGIRMRILEYTHFRKAKPNSSLKLPLITNFFNQPDKVLLSVVIWKLFRLQISNFLRKNFHIFMNNNFLTHLTSASFVVQFRKVPFWLNALFGFVDRRKDTRKRMINFISWGLHFLY